MQRLFDFSPSAAKPLHEFFRTSEECAIIRQHVGRGYFVAVPATYKGFAGPVPCLRMYWIIKHPSESKRLNGRGYTYVAVEGSAAVNS